MNSLAESGIIKLTPAHKVKNAIFDSFALTIVLDKPEPWVCNPEEMEAVMAVVAAVIVILIVLALVAVTAALVHTFITHRKARAVAAAQEEAALAASDEPEDNNVFIGDLFAEDPFKESSGESSGDENSSGEGEDSAQSNAVQAMETELLAYDKLCSLIIGRSYLERCNELLERARQHNHIYAVAYIDIDRFRFINSIKGFSLGDYVLVNLAQELEQIFPESSLITRISADHFVVLFPAADSSTYFDEYYNQMLRACERIRDAVGVKGAIRVCIGLALTDSSSSPIAYNMSVLISKANIARHCQKIVKSEAYFQYEEAMITSSLYGESALDDYSENQYSDDFTIYYQSIRDASNNRMAGCDAFVRWICQEEKDTGQLTPDNGRLPSNILKIFYQVCRAASRWRKAGKDITPLYINITEIEFFKGDFDEFAARCLSEFQLEPGLINIVVDASLLRINWNIAANQIKRLRDTGFKVGVCGIDNKTQNLDFLAGLPVGFIKLQSSFSKGITKHENKVETLRYMLAMAESQNLRVVVEGVDTIEQMQTMRKIGVSLIEGRYTGIPSNPDDFMRTLEEFVATRGQNNDSTVIYDDVSLNRGDYQL